VKEIPLAGIDLARCVLCPMVLIGLLFIYSRYRPRLDPAGAFHVFVLTFIIYQGGMPKNTVFKHFLKEEEIKRGVLRFVVDWIFTMEVAMLWLLRKQRTFIAVFFLAIFSLFLMSHRVYAAPTPPPVTTSYYIEGISDAAMYELGCQLGTRDGSIVGTQNNIVFLFYGKPAKDLVSGAFGTKLLDPNNTFASVTQIRDSAKQFGRGYWWCTGSDSTSHVTVAISTSNLGNKTTYNHGKAWAGMVIEAHQWLIDNSYSTQATIVGGSDMELDWNGPTSTRYWVDGYSSVPNRRPYYNAGDAAGCPPLNNSNNGDDCGTATYPNWTADDVRYISFGAPPAYAFPQIYSNTGIHARQWQWISANRGFINFEGPMSQSAACAQNGCNADLDNTPAQAWQQLYDTINSVQSTADSLRWLSDVSW
jgi:hypothetical protein